MNRGIWAVTGDYHAVYIYLDAVLRIGGCIFLSEAHFQLLRLCGIQIREIDVERIILSGAAKHPGHIPIESGNVPAMNFLFHMHNCSVALPAGIMANYGSVVGDPVGWTGEVSRESEPINRVF